MPQLLTPEARTKALAALDGWSEDPDRDAITKTFWFDTFDAAWGWMSRVAIKAETLVHHPEWTNVYGRVDVLLTTHTEGGLTELDIDLATFMDAAAKSTGSAELG